MNKAEFSDNTWICKYCGAMNAAYLEECGRCNKEKDD